MQVCYSKFYSLKIGPWVLKQFFDGGSSKMRCDHDFDQVLLKTSWGSAYSINKIDSLANQGQFVDIK